MRLQEQKRTNRVIMNLLRNFSEDNPHMKEVVAETLEGVGLRMMGRPGSSGSVRSRNGTGLSRPGSSDHRPTSRGRHTPGSRGPMRSGSRDELKMGFSQNNFEFPPVDRPGSSRSQRSSNSRPGSRGSRPPSSRGGGRPPSGSGGYGAHPDSARSNRSISSR